MKTRLLKFFLLSPLLCLALAGAAQSITQISAGGYHSLFLRSDGSLWGTGLSFYGQLGDGNYYPAPYEGTNRPEMILGTNGLTTVTAIAAGGYHSLFLRSDHSLWGMGYNQDDELGDGNNVNTNLPVEIVPGFTPTYVTAVATAPSARHSLFIKNDGSLWAMGSDVSGQLGDGTNVDSIYPEAIVSSGVTNIAAGASHSLFIKSDGSLWAMGLNNWGQLGDGSQVTTNRPKMIVPGGVTVISAGESISAFIKSDGSLWVMGKDENIPPLGFTNRPDMLVPSGVTAVSCGGAHLLFIKSDGSLWGLGHDQYYQLGDGQTNTVYVPEQIVPSGVIAVAAGGYHSLFLKSDHSLWAMGWNNWGQLGDGTENYTSKRPELIIPGTSASSTNQISFYLLDAGIMQFTFVGGPGANYALDRTANLFPPNWVPQVTNAANSFGVLVVTNAINPATNNFWRFRWVP